jgi:hypothetical protein
MNEKGYPEVKEVETPQLKHDFKYSVEWYEYQYACMKQYFSKVLLGWSIKDFFGEIEYYDIAIYSVTDFSDMVIKDLVRNRIRRIVVADGSPEKYPDGLNGYDVISVQELYELYKEQKIKKVIVCNVFCANEIMQNLLKVGFDLSDVITFKTILEN